MHTVNISKQRQHRKQTKYTRHTKVTWHKTRQNHICCLKSLFHLWGNYSAFPVIYEEWYYMAVQNSFLTNILRIHLTYWRRSLIFQNAFSFVCYNTLSPDSSISLVAWFQYLGIHSSHLEPFFLLLLIHSIIFIVDSPFLLLSFMTFSKCLPSKDTMSILCPMMNNPCRTSSSLLLCCNCQINQARTQALVWFCLCVKLVITHHKSFNQQTACIFLHSK